MPDALYDRDILAWSEHQADLLRRMARGERVNHVDWENLIEEIEDVGRSQLDAVESYLTLIMAHVLKLHLWATDQAVRHWREETVVFQKNAKRKFAPSMRQRIDLEVLYSDAIEQLRAIDPATPLAPLPEAVPFTLEQLLSDRWDGLLRRLPPP